jgi:anaerobic C4-dicarboxylate transporter
MTDRTDDLLAEHVELQRTQVYNQELMMARQAQAVAAQQRAIVRQRKFNRSVWIFIGALVVMMLVVPVLNFFARTRR